MAIRRSPRLASFDYRGQHAYFLTFVTAERRPAFRSPALVDSVAEALRSSAQKYDFRIHAYCFMPDHLHLLVSGGEDSPLENFARHVKQMTGFAHKRTTGRRLWQPSYWDRVMRMEDDLLDVAEYIWANPVRAGLVASWREYPFSGPRPLPNLI